MQNPVSNNNKSLRNSWPRVCRVYTFLPTWPRTYIYTTHNMYRSVITLCYVIGSLGRTEVLDRLYYNIIPFSNTPTQQKSCYIVTNTV